MTPHRSPAAATSNEVRRLAHPRRRPRSRALGSDPELGLSTSRGRDAAGADGPNRLDEKREDARLAAVRLASYNDFMIYVLLVAVGISAFEGQVPESIAILAILLLNGVLGFVQEYRAEKALDALKQLSAPIATVIRDGAESDIPAEQLVPGDIVLLEAGDKVPADGRLARGGGAARGRVRAHGREQARPQARRRRCRSPTPPRRPARHGVRRHVGGGRSRPDDRHRHRASPPRWARSPTCSRATDDETTPLQKELAIVGQEHRHPRARDRCDRVLRGGLGRVEQDRGLADRRSRRPRVPRGLSAGCWSRSRWRSQRSPRGCRRS